MRFVRLVSPGRILLLATILVSGYMLVSAGGNFLHSYRLAGDESRLQEELHRLQAEKEQLIQVREYLRSDEYVEFMARRVFGLVRPGEKLLIVEAPPPQRGEEPADLTWWQRLFGGY